MNAGDPLRTVELLALLEEATTPLRHDIRNRIASIRNLSYFVRRKLSSEVAPERDPRVNDFLSKIESEVQRTDDLIDAWSTSVQTLRSSAVVRTSVADWVRLALDSARVPVGAGVEFTAPSEAIEVEGDREMLAFALRCLLENAAEAAGAGRVRIVALRDANLCHVSVTDHGPGIADPVRCLERFETTKPGHLGLGLCMARRIALRFGGELVIGSPQTGAEVSLVVPIAGTRPLPEPEP